MLEARSMNQKIIKGGIIGGLVVFVWGMLSWMVLPWHKPLLKPFKDEGIVRPLLVSNASQSGVYILPHQYGDDQKTGEEPFVFTVMNPKGLAPIGFLMLRSLAIQILGAGLVTWLLLQTRLPDDNTRLGFVVIVALTAGVVCHLPNWNWWGFPTDYTFVQIADLTIGWFFAGLAILKIVLK